MASKAYQNQKRTLKYSKSQVEKAARNIRHGCKGDERKEAILKIQNYRETHLYPLMLIKDHLYRTTKKVSKKGVVARRLKMLATIIDKLERPTLDGKKENAIQIKRMQDIGGCRAIVANVKQLNDLHERLKKSRSKHKIIRTYNYLEPKESGYSGIHLVYSCFEGSDEDSEWKKTKIEVQLRTELQHAWATSLEIIDTLESIKLKTSMEGYPQWRRFFQIAGQLVAHSEGSYCIKESDLPSLIKELIELENLLNVRKKLANYILAINITNDKKNLPKRIQSHQGMFLVRVFRPIQEENKESQEKILIKIPLHLEAYEPKNVEIALKKLADAEADNNITIAVLVSAKDVRSLYKAYPNYFGSTTKFREFLSNYIDSQKAENL